MGKFAFDGAIAKAVGVHGAILFSHIAFWTSENKKAGRNEHDGRFWTFSSVRELAEKFDFMTAEQIRTALKKLENAGLIQRGNFNKRSYDRTTWYALTDAGTRMVTHLGKIPNGSGNNPKSIREKSQMDLAGIPNGFGKNPGPIPDNYQIDKNRNEDGNNMESPLSPLSEIEPFPDWPQIQKVVQEWLDYKSERGQAYKSTGRTALEALIAEKVREFGESAVVSVVRESMAAGYAGIVWGNLRRNKNEHEKSWAELAREMDERERRNLFSDS